MAVKSSYDRYVEGTESVLKNLNNEIAKIEGRISKGGMWKCLLLLEREAKKITPVGPSKLAKKQIAETTGRSISHIGTGNLQNSYSTYVFSSFDAVEGLLVNSALYALFVHEMPQTYHFTKPGTGPKFMEKPLFDNGSKILTILRNSAQIL